VHDLPLECVQPLDGGEFRLIQLADGADEEIRAYGILGAELGVLATFDFDVNPPFLGCIVPVGGFDGAVEADVTV